MASRSTPALRAWPSPGRAVVFALLLFYCLTFANAFAETPTFFLLSPPKNAAFTETLKEQLLAVDPTLRVQRGEIDSFPQSQDNAVYVSIGKQALSTLLASKAYLKQKIVAALISSRDYHIAVESARRKASITALFSDPSPYYQLELIQQLQPDAKFAFIFDGQNKHLLKALSSHADKLGFPPPYFVDREKFSNLNNLLNDRALADVDFVLATPNPNLYKRENTKNIIFTLLSRKQALIGYSSGWVKSGGLATVYSAKDDIVRSLAEHLHLVSTTETLPAPQYPSFFKVELNKNIMKLLNFSDQSADELALKLRGNHAQ